MNGRIYDAKLGRFLQADPIIQAPYNTQSLNRYSYTLNNPLNAVDPSGFNWFNTVLDVIKIVVAVVIAVTTQCYQCAAAIIGTISAFQAIANGGSFGDALLAGLTSAALTYFGGKFFVDGALSGLEAFKLGVIGGIGATLQGGKFGHGFVSAGAGAYIGSKIGGFVKGAGNAIRNTGTFIARVTLGGALSKVTGGKFANGAGYAAFSAAVSYAATTEPTVNNRSLNKAIKHLNKSEEFRSEYAKAKRFGVKININNETSSYFDHETNTVQWNSLEGNNIEAGISSPATTLAHEITHAVEFNELGLEGFEASLEAPVLSTDYSIGNDGIPEIKVIYGVSQEEIRATNFERTVQSQLGEPLRQNYRDAGPVNVESSTYFCHQGNEGCR